MPILVAARPVAPNIRLRRLNLKRLERLIFSIVLTSLALHRSCWIGAGGREDLPQNPISALAWPERESNPAIGRTGIAFHFYLTGRAARHHKRVPEKKNVED